MIHTLQILKINILKCDSNELSADAVGGAYELLIERPRVCINHYFDCDMFEYAIRQIYWFMYYCSCKISV